jgi:hypothetical protein
MTGVRTRLADAIDKHALQNHGVIVPRELADVLLSLPDIAIVELPEANDKGGWPCGCDGTRVWLDHRDLCVRTICQNRVHNPRAFAAALLAAANAAEGHAS